LVKQVTCEKIWRKGQGHWELKCRNRFSCKLSWKVDRFTQNQEWNNPQLIFYIKIMPEYWTLHQRKCLFFVIFVRLSVCRITHMPIVESE